MSRITGSEVASLMEAYNAVYAPQELTEEQVWEEVENWVNSLVEEGYDLSDYTWEEMYESYLSEMGQRMTTGQMTAPKAAPTPTSRPQVAGGGMGGRRGGGSSPGGLRRSTSTAAAPAATPAPAAAPRPAATASRPAATPAAKPAAKVTPSKPAATAASKPATGMLGKTSFERRTPTSAELKAAQSARASGASPEKALQAAKSAGGALSQATAAASKPAAFSPSTAAAKTAPTPKMTPRQQRLNMEMEYDAYDIVLEYLLSEGHVETVEEAHYVMMEMDSETIGTIVEAAKDQSDKQIEKGVKTTYKAGNVLDNTHQGRSPGLNKLPRGEREEKAQRMRGRLKARRDDLFKERGNREDEKREKLKKLLGL